jgi:adenosylhomocysteinase
MNKIMEPSYKLIKKVNMATIPSHDVGDIKLAQKGKEKIEWAGRSMQVLKTLESEYKRSKPFAGKTIGACLHVTSETANLMIALKAGGAHVSLCASNPLSTQDEVAASLVNDYGISCYAIHGEDNKTYYKHLNAVLDTKPDVTMDDGADLVNLLHTKRRELLSTVVGSSEETTTGVIRLKAMEHDGKLSIPVVAVNDSDTKHLFDNRYGTGQSTIDGIIRATNMLLAGKVFVVAGYGYCSRGIADRARGMGSQVIVTEVDPVRALEAVMDGFQVMPMKQAIKYGDVFVSATGDKAVITLEHMRSMKDGAVVANSGHFNVELEYEKLVKAAKKVRKIRGTVEAFSLGGKTVHVIGEGRLVNLVAAEGHPAEVMDMSFANQALAAEWILDNQGTLKPQVYRLPPKLDKKVARLKLQAMGVKIDRLSKEQKRYLQSWQEGT